MFEREQQRVIRSLDDAHSAYYRAGIFGGPSLYFHQLALKAAKEGELARFAEVVYGLLAAWGMHRMGRGGSKMRDFEAFYGSLEPLWPTILRLQRATPGDLGESDWEDLRVVFSGVRCMATGTSLVGNSKVLAHALPNLVPPVDREYTLRFLFGNKNIANDISKEWNKLQSILLHFFYPVVRSSKFIEANKTWSTQTQIFPWDTSPLKTVDNLIIGIMKGTRADDVVATDGRRP
jgi:hypothetical protein